jgi:PilZ domain-containing protein
LERSSLEKKLTTDDKKSRRLRERIALSLPVRVMCRESVDHEWTEMSRLVDVTPFGARLRLTRPTEIGRLLLLTMAMPRQLRCFDHVEDQYRVWSLVRNLVRLDPATEKGAMVEIGVAFVGKHPPISFLSNPAQLYDIAPLERGQWSIKEQPARADTDKRKESRHIIPIEVTIEPVGEAGSVGQKENTVTENISRKGAAVFSMLGLQPGRFLRMSSTQHGVAVFAVVRDRRIGADGIPRLHLEFIGGEWPL